MAVRRKADGQTFYWIQDGVLIEVNMMEPQFGILQETQDLQISAKNQNATNKDHYMTSLANAQISEDASRPYAPITTPLMIVVTDPVMDDFGDVTGGVQSSVPWVPPLPTIKLKGK
jgi:hypothetical protein